MLEKFVLKQNPSGLHSDEDATPTRLSIRWSFHISSWIYSLLPLTFSIGRKIIYHHVEKVKDRNGLNQFVRIKILFSGVHGAPFTSLLT